MGQPVTISFPPEASLRPRRGARRGGDPELGGRRRGVTVRLDGIDLVIFDKDGTLIEFGPMWSGWAETLARLARGGHRPADRDPAVRDARLRPRRADGPARRRARGDADGAAARADRRRPGRRRAWTARPPSGRSTRPGTRRTRSSWPGRLTDLPALFGRLRAAGLRLAVATSDDREPDRSHARGARPDRRHRGDGLRRRRRPGQAGAGHGPAPVRGSRRGARPGPRSSAMHRPTCAWHGRPVPAWWWAS